ncbi:MAG: hypothetical protein H0X03_01140 [Nitrosopumilus sp.]|nr:hypothetical protein [Nitrosopumilus sp.]
MEERKFLYNLCSEALRIDDSIKFAAVVNHNGKLIVGKSREQMFQENDIMVNSFFKSRPNQLFSIFSNHSDNFNSIVNKKNILLNSNLVKRSVFQLININKYRYIAFATLTEDQDKSLCIYIRTHNSVYKTLIKLNTLFE